MWSIPIRSEQLLGHSRNIYPISLNERLDKDGIFEVPKTLIFAKTDSHADDIIQIVRQEFEEENRFCKKITYTSDKDKLDSDENVVEKGEDPKNYIGSIQK